MDTQQLYPLVDGKIPQSVPNGLDFVRGVYYAGQFVPVIEVEGELFTELSFDQVVASLGQNNPGWNWDDEDCAASADATPWPTAALDPDTRTFRGMMSATRGERRDRLMSNDRPLRLRPEDEASLKREIAAALARQQDADSGS